MCVASSQFFVARFVVVQGRGWQGGDGRGGGGGGGGGGGSTGGGGSRGAKAALYVAHRSHRHIDVL